MPGQDVFLLMLGALSLLALLDLVVGVSNDAVNFLNSAIGSKVVPIKHIMIIACIGVLLGALFSTGMMEVARKGIFDPGGFHFDEIMIIFMAVMIADVLLLDFFNTLGMPTSTTVSIVFEILGASVCIAATKVFSSGGSITQILEYINTSKATEIILGILLSVIIAFVAGAIVQFFSRLLLTFRFEKRPIYISVFFGGVAITSIIYFLLIKGLKGTTLLESPIAGWIYDNGGAVVLVNFVFWSVFSWVFIRFMNCNIYKFIVVIGTFSLAMAFAGNDLVNFIGVPVAAWQSYEIWSSSGVDASLFSMEGLGEKVQSPTLILLLAGLVMASTIWFSKKAHRVLKTSIDLSSQDVQKERFKSNRLSQIIVRFTLGFFNLGVRLFPESVKRAVDYQFSKVNINLPTKNKLELPAFDVVRAAVNLMVSSILISFATSLKLPLSTTYVTFMVAMGSSFSDRAWGVDSAVYRVAGVLNVIGGWFLTAILAFLAAAIFAYIISMGGATVVAMLLVLVVLIITKNVFRYNKTVKKDKKERQLNKSDSKTIKGIIKESVGNISDVMRRSEVVCSRVVEGLSTKDISLLKKNKKGMTKLNDEIEDLRQSIFYFIREQEDPPFASSRFYILIIRYLQDLADSSSSIAKMSYNHVNNNHKGLTFRQITDIKEVESQLSYLMEKVEESFEELDFNEGIIRDLETTFLTLINENIEKQIERTKSSDDSSPKNTILYFSLLLETKDLLNSVMNLYNIYQRECRRFYNSAKMSS